jgi:hypothetical protein
MACLLGDRSERVLEVLCFSDGHIPDDSWGVVRGCFRGLNYLLGERDG